MGLQLPEFPSWENNSGCCSIHFKFAIAAKHQLINGSVLSSIWSACQAVSTENHVSYRNYFKACLLSIFLKKVF